MNDTTPVIINNSKNLIPTITYILKNKDNKYYCGKTSNMERRMNEHAKDKWKDYKLVWIIRGDHESKIKVFGVKRFYNCITTGVVS